MPDIRELVILNPRAIALGRNRLAKRIFDGLRMALRRLVLHTGNLPVFRQTYMGVYRVHVWAAKMVLTRFEGTRAIYLSGGVGRGEVRPGISDIDLVIFGDWDEPTQFRVLKYLAIIVLTMPLFDRESLGAIQTWDDFLRINRTDLFLAYQYAPAKRRWKLLWGEDLIQGLPDISKERRAGAAYLEVRRWWGLFARMALGRNVTAQDAVFRNSLSFKAVADVLRAESFAENCVPPLSRTEALLSEMPAADIELRDCLLRSEARQFLSMDGDPREFVASWLLERIEYLHQKLLNTPSFESVALPRIEGTADERSIAVATMAHAEGMAGEAALLPGFKAAYLLPCASFFSPDSLALCIEFDATQLPTMARLREWIAPQLEVLMDLPQRVPIYLLLEHGAYLLDCVFGLEVWSNVLMPHANPDFFELLSRPEFVLRGTPRMHATTKGWSRVRARPDWTTCAISGVFCNCC
jgi:predicted nucleotidyltransferase